MIKIYFVTALFILIFATQSLAAQKKKIATEYKHTQGEVGLINAVKSCDIQATKMILELGVNPNFKIDPFFDSTPLIESLIAGDTDKCSPVVLALLGKGADPSVRNKAGDTAMYVAATNLGIAVETIKALETSKANVATPHPGNSNVIKGTTPLMFFSRDTVTVNASLDRADRGFCDYAICSTQVKHFEYLTQHGDINQQDSKGNTALHYAVINGASFTARHLVVAGADTKIKNKAGQTPAGLALASGRSDIIAAFTLR